MSGPSEFPEEKSSKLRRIGILFFGLAVFFFFLIWKLPEARIQNLILAHLRILAQQQGFSLSAEKIKPSFLLGPAIKFYNIELKSLEDEKQVLKIPFLRVSPKLTSLFTPTKQAKLSAELLDGELWGSLGSSTNETIIDLHLKNIHFGKTTMLKPFLPLDLSAEITGQVQLNLNFLETQKSEGRINLSIEKFTSPAQSVFGFNLPQLSIKESKIDISVAKGQFFIRSFEVGKDVKSDDVVARVTGDGTLDKFLYQTRLNGKAVFELSPKVMQNFPLLDAILGQAKTPDGKFSYRLSGTVGNPQVNPGG